MNSSDLQNVAHSWYMLRVSPGFEDKVVDMLLASVSNSGVEDLCGDVFVPCEDVTRIRRGKKISVRRKLFPGYVFVKISPIDYMLKLVKSVPKVMGFLGIEGVPKIISDEEVNSIKEKVESGGSFLSSSSVSYEVGEEIKIIDGPFQSFVGTVASYNDSRGILKVVISIFGRTTGVELEVSQVEKIGG